MSVIRIANVATTMYMVRAHDGTVLFVGSKAACVYYRNQHKGE